MFTNVKKKRFSHIWYATLYCITSRILLFKKFTLKIEKMFAHFILQSYHHFLTRSLFINILDSGRGQVLFLMLIWRLSTRFAWRPECINIIQ